MEQEKVHEKPRILVVDDSPFNREMLAGMIDREGYKAVLGKNGREALDSIAESTFDLIIMDLLMPGMDGIETIKRIRALGIGTPIVMITAMNTKQDRQRCLDAGGDDFLSKPVSHGEVQRIFDKHIRIERSVSTEKNKVQDELLHASSNRTFSGFHILLVEEDSRLAEQYATFFENHKFEITNIASGTDALKSFQENERKYQIVLSNLFAPGIDGLGILARIKRDDPNVIVFIYGDSLDHDTFQLAIQLGADGVVNTEELESSVMEIIETLIFYSDQEDTKKQAASTISQVRKAQSKLFRYGCDKACQMVDIGYSTLNDAGGDLACCRRFNESGLCGIFIGDVSGHSVMSSYISAVFSGILTSNWDEYKNPKELAVKMNAELIRLNFKNYHLCATMILWDRLRKKILMSSAGNPGVLCARQSHSGEWEFEKRQGGGMCLGLIENDHLFVHDEFEFTDFDYLFFHSDGIVKNRIKDILKVFPADMKRSAMKGLSQKIIDRFLSEWWQNDDMMLVSLNNGKVFEENTLHYSFLSGYDGVDSACNWIMAQFIPDHIPKGKDPDLIMLAVREVLLNAVIHGNRLDTDAWVDVLLEIQPDSLKIVISDQGTGFNLPMAMEKVKGIDILEFGGRGLSVISSVTDDVRTKGSSIILIFKNSAI